MGWRARAAGLLAIVLWAAPASALRYEIGPGSVFTPEGAAAGSMPFELSGDFELVHVGICPLPCTSRAYALQDLSLEAAGHGALSNGLFDPDAHFVGPSLTSSSFEVLDDGELQTSSFVAQRDLLETGALTGDPYGHASYDLTLEVVLGQLAYLGPDPRHVDFDDPDDSFPSRVVLAWTIAERTRRIDWGWDGVGPLSLNRVADESIEPLGIVFFDATPVPEPATAVLLGLGLGSLLIAERRWPG